MPRIIVSEETYARVLAFLRLARVLTEMELTPDRCAETRINVGMNLTLERIWGQHEKETLLKSLMKLAARHPEEVYSFVADVLETGSEAQREEARQRAQLGFNPPPKDEG